MFFEYIVRTNTFRPHQEEQPTIEYSTSNLAEASFIFASGVPLYRLYGPSWRRRFSFEEPGRAQALAQAFRSNVVAPALDLDNARRVLVAYATEMKTREQAQRQADDAHASRGGAR